MRSVLRAAGVPGDSAINAVKPIMLRIMRKSLKIPRQWPGSTVILRLFGSYHGFLSALLPTIALAFTLPAGLHRMYAF